MRVQERESGFFTDLEDLLTRLVPQDEPSASGCCASCSARAASRSRSVPATLCLGQWQRILLLGFDRPSAAPLDLTILG